MFRLVRGIIRNQQVRSSTLLAGSSNRHWDSPALGARRGLSALCPRCVGTDDNRQAAEVKGGRDEADMDWNVSDYQGYKISTGRLPTGRWKATISGIPVTGSTATAPPGSGEPVPGEFDSEEAALDAAKKHIDLLG